MRSGRMRNGLRRGRGLRVSIWGLRGRRIQAVGLRCRRRRWRRRILTSSMSRSPRIMYVGMSRKSNLSITRSTPSMRIVDYSLIPLPPFSDAILWAIRESANCITSPNIWIQTIRGLIRRRLRKKLVKWKSGMIKVKGCQVIMSNKEVVSIHKNVMG